MKHEHTGAVSGICVAKAEKYPLGDQSSSGMVLQCSALFSGVSERKRRMFY